MLGGKTKWLAERANCGRGVGVSPGNCAALGSLHTPGDPRGCIYFGYSSILPQRFPPPQYEGNKALDVFEEFILKRYI